VLTFQRTSSLDACMRTTSRPCQLAQRSLFARADGEAGRAEAAQARLRALHCARCRDFAAAISEQRKSLATPALPDGAERRSARVRTKHPRPGCGKPTALVRAMSHATATAPAYRRCERD
jgi:hypothetical protein